MRVRVTYFPIELQLTIKLTKYNSESLKSVDFILLQDFK